MHFEISTVDSAVQYTYRVDTINYCTFSANKGVIYIKLVGFVPFNDLVSALSEVTKMVLQEGNHPQVNVTSKPSNTRNVIINLLKKCGYRSIPSYGIHFSIWSYTKSSLA